MGLIPCALSAKRVQDNTLVGSSWTQRSFRTDHLDRARFATDRATFVKGRKISLIRSSSCARPPQASNFFEGPPSQDIGNGLTGETSDGARLPKHSRSNAGDGTRRGDMQKWNRNSLSSYFAAAGDPEIVMQVRQVEHVAIPPRCSASHMTDPATDSFGSSPVSY